MGSIPSFLNKAIDLGICEAVVTSTNNLKKAELAIHEYLGITWTKLRGQI